MARKKKPSNRKPNRPAKPASSPPPIPPIDRRVLEASLHQFARSLGGEAGDLTLMQAQEIMYQAFEEPNPTRRIQLAREALAVSPDCADAYVLLAEHAPRRKDAVAFYEQGVAAGERAIGPEKFAEYTGHFWGVLDTRPYMRARIGLAHALWEVGRREESVTHLQDMLRLNPNDNQGLRYTLAGWLLYFDRDDDLSKLIEQYKDEGTATWLYTQALLAFRREGDTIDARRLLKAARKANKHVPDYLTGRKYPPHEQLDYYSPGDESEALQYVSSFMAGWKATAGAVAWLRANEGKSKSEQPAAKGPLGVIKKWMLGHLEKKNEVWQADFRQLPSWLGSESGPVRPWLVLVVNCNAELVLTHALIETAPTAERLWDVLLQAMQHPMAGSPGRPAEVQVRARAEWESLRPHLDEVGINLTTPDRLNHLEDIFTTMSQHLGGDERPAPGLMASGITLAQAGAFYDAAADFFVAKPWKLTGYESAIRIESDFPGGPRFGVLMGQSGLTSGLALYDDLATLRLLWSREIDDRANVEETSAVSVTFGEAWTIPIADHDMAQLHGWRVARPDAYPEVMCKGRGLTMRMAQTWEVRLLEACLRAVPAFVARRKQDDPTREEFTVPTATGDVKLTLAWVVED